jgi:hypothetical protein
MIVYLVGGIFMGLFLRPYVDKLISNFLNNK